MSCSIPIKQICEFSTAPPSTRHLYLHHSGTHAGSSPEASERPTELTSPRCHHDPKPVWVLKSSVEMFPVAASLLVVLFSPFPWFLCCSLMADCTGVCFLKVLCVVFTHECCIFTSKFQLGPGLRGSLTSVHHAGFVTGLLGGEKKKLLWFEAKSFCLIMVKVTTTHTRSTYLIRGRIHVHWKFYT